MGDRSEIEIYTHVIRSGIDENKPRKISSVHGLKGAAAGKFVRDNKALIGEITWGQQVVLFDVTYPIYINRAMSVYDKWTRSEFGRVEWEGLDPVIRDVLVDFVYQGFTAGPNPMRSGMRNSRTEMILYIETTAATNQYEPGRRRAEYLRNN